MYEYGELIQVQNTEYEEWKDRIYIGPALGGGVYTISADDEADFESGASFFALPHKFHRKKQLITTEVPMPMREAPVMGKQYFRIDSKSTCGYVVMRWGGYDHEYKNMRNGFCFSTEGDAKAFVAAMRALVKG